MTISPTTSAVVLCLLPSGLVIAQLSHAILFAHIGEFYILLHPAVMLLAPTSVQAVLLGARFPSPPLLPYFGVAVMSAGFVISALYGGAGFSYTTRAIVLGIFPMALMYCFLGPHQDKRLYAIAIAVGLLVWGAAVVALYAHYLLSMLQQFPHLRAMAPDEVILALRSPGLSVGNQFPFFQIFGNVNKIANLAVLATIGAFAVYLKIGRGVVWLIVFCIVMSAILLFTFSRGAIVAAAVCGFIALAASIRTPRQDRVKYLLFSALLALPALVALTSETLRHYSFDTSTLQTRVEQWKYLSESEPSNSSLPRLLFGYGPGLYGEINFGTPDARTHNMLLNIWTDGGLLAVFGFTMLLIIPLVQGVKVLWKRWNHQAFAGVLGLLAISALGLREYELAYLNTDSMGAVMLGWFIALTIVPKVPPQNAKSAADSSPTQDNGRIT